MADTKKIKILRIINRFNIGGPIHNAVMLSAFMPDEYETLLVCGQLEENEASSIHIAEKYGLKPILLDDMKRQLNYKNDQKALKQLKEIILAFKPDIVHTHASKAGALGRKAAFDCKVPIVVHTFHGHVFHSYFNWWKTKLYRIIEKRLAKKTTGIIAISELQKNELSLKYKICEAEKIEIIHLGFDLRPFNENKTEHRKKTRDAAGLKDSEIAVAIIGRLVPVKNHDMFLKCINAVHEKTTKKVVYFIVGGGEDFTSIDKKVSVLKAKGMDIRMTSWINDINVFNAGMDVICLTSKNEGTPVSLIEAQAAGIPFIATKVGGIKDIVSENNTGYLVELDDYEAFNEKLLYLIENKNKRQEMSQKGWSFVKEKFQYTTLIAKTDTYYKFLLNQKNICA